MSTDIRTIVTRTLAGRFVSTTLALTLAGCSGSGLARAPFVSPDPILVATSPGAETSTSQTLGSSPTEIHVVVEDGIAVGLLLAPAGATIPAPFVTRPLPFGVVQYPDGSTQTADANGIFDATQSSYALARAELLASNAEAAPYVVVSDPADLLPPLVTQIEAARTTPGNVANVLPLNSYAHVLVGSGSGLGSLGVRPRTQGAIDGTTVVLTAAGVDNDGHAASLGGFDLQWHLDGVGTIVPVPGTSSAFYAAPTGGSGIDRVTVAIPATSTKPAYSASGAIAFVDRASLAHVEGTLARAAAPVARGTMAFYQRTGLPAHFHPFVWFAPVANGKFAANLPPRTAFVPLARVANGPISLAMGSHGEPAYESPARDATPGAPAAFFAASDAPAFVDPFESAPPPVAAYVHDAWYASRQPMGRHIFDADSGIQAILARPNVAGGNVVPDGSFRFWHYAWQPSANPTLILVAATRSGAGGREAYAVTRALGDPPGRYTYVHYDSAAPLALARPLVAAQPGVVRTATGSWTQSLGSSGDFAATVSRDVYSASSQAAPTYSETLAYARAASGETRIARDTMRDASGVKQWSLDATRGPIVRANAGTPAKIYDFSATLTRYYHHGNRAREERFTTIGSATGDGGGSVTYRELASGIATSFDLAPSSSSGDRATNGTVIVRENPHPIATFHITKNQIVEAIVGADPQSGEPGTSIAFPL